MWIKSCTGARVNLHHVDKIKSEDIPKDTRCRVIAFGRQLFDTCQVLFEGTDEECENYLQHLDVYLGVACAEVILNPRNREAPK